MNAWLEGRQRQPSGLRQLTAPIDGEAFPAVEPRITEESKDSFLFDIRSEVGPRLVDQCDLIRFMGRAGGIVIGDTPLRNPTGFTTGAALGPAFRQDIFL